MIIKQEIEKGHTKFAICPFGSVGKRVKDIMDKEFQIHDPIILDEYEEGAEKVNILSKLPNIAEIYILLATEHEDVFSIKMEQLLHYTDRSHLIPLYMFVEGEYSKKRKQLEKNFNFEEKIYRFEEDDVCLYLPLWDRDWGQNRIAFNGNFYESDYLDYIKSVYGSRIKGNTVLDIGANIGNHSVYFAKKIEAARVYSFEPIRENYENLRRNIDINNLGDKVYLRKVALGEKRSGGARISYSENNVGGTRINSSVQDEGAEFEIVPLDELEFEGNIALIKIDVEGFEFKVLRGAIETIKKHHPIIMCESLEMDNNLDGVWHLMRDLGYTAKAYSRDDYIFEIASE